MPSGGRLRGWSAAFSEEELGITLEAAIEAEAEAFLLFLLLLASLAVSSTKTAQALALSYDTGRKLEAKFMKTNITSFYLSIVGNFHLFIFNFFLLHIFIKIKEVF